MARYSILNDGIDLPGGDAGLALPAGSGHFPALSLPMREAQLARGSAKGASPVVALLEPVDPTPMGNAPTVTIAQTFATLGGETRVNTTTAGSQWMPKATPLANGGYVVVWAGGDNNLDIMGQRYDVSGQPAGSEFSVTVAGLASPIAPAVTALADGSFVVAWASGAPTISNERFVVSRHFNAAGQPLTGNGNIVNTSPITGASFNMQPDITSLSDGTYIVTWLTTSGNGIDIHGQRYNSAEVKLGTEFGINTTTGASQTECSVAALPGGGFVVTWSSTGQDGSGEGVYGQRYGANGVAVGTEFRVNSATTGNQWHSEVTALVGGGFLVTWAGPDSGGQSDIFAQRYDSNGAVVGSEFRVNSTTASYQNEPEVGALADGGFIVAWSSPDAGTGNNVYAQRYNADGSARGGEFRVNSTLTDVQEVQSIAVLQDGQIAIVWQSNGQDGSDWGVYSQRFSDGFLATEQVSKNLKSTVTVGDDLTSNLVTVVLSVDSGVLTVAAGGSGASVSGSGTASVTLTGTVAQINALLNTDATSAFSYFADADKPPSRAMLTVAVTDNENKTASTTAGIGITATSEFATAKADAATTSEVAVKSGNLFADNGSGADTSIGGQALIVSAINSNSAAVGTTIALASGALLTVQSDGSYIYNPNGQFTALGAAGSGASNLSAQDSFTYTLVNGNTATVSLTVTGIDNDDVLQGTSGDDVLAGGAGADTIEGGEGRDRLYSAALLPLFNNPHLNNPFTPPTLDTGTEVDTLRGGGGSDRIFAGYGDNVDGGEDGTTGDYLYISFMGASSGVTVDFRLGTQVIGGGTVTGVENISWIQGSNFDDNIDARTTNFGGNSDYTAVYGMGGNDTLIAGYYTGHMYGGDGNDIVDGRTSQYLMLVSGGDGDDTLYTRNSYLIEADGGAGNDTIYAHATTRGGTGNDLIIMQFSSYPGARTFGDEGDDEIRAASTGNTTFGGTGNDLLLGNTGIDNLSGGDDADTLYGGDQADVLIGGTGADILNGDAGNDSLWSGPGVVEVPSTAPTGAPDTGIEHDELFGGAGNDQLSIGYGDDADGGADTDTLSIALGGAASGVTLNTTGIVSGGTVGFAGGAITGIERIGTIWGSGFADTITLGAQATIAIVDGGAGNDTLNGSSGVDNLQGGIGDDRLDGMAGADAMTGGAGNDLFIVDNAGDTVIEGATGNIDTDTVNAYASWTMGAGQEIERLRAGPGTDPINLTGNELGQKITGNNGANTLTGGGGNDNLNGNDGADIVIGGTGLDKLTGGNGADTFVMQIGGQMDRITDFATGIDKIDLTAFGTMTFQQVLDAATENLGTTMIDLGGGDLIQLLGVTKASLGTGDFLLTGSSGVAPWPDALDSALCDGAAGQIVTDGPQHFLPVQVEADMWNASDWHAL